MARRRAWDVEDPKKLRRNIGTGEDFSNDRYWRLWVPAGADYSTAALGAINNAWSAYTFGVADLVLHTSFSLPAYWNRGMIQAKVWGRTANVAAGQIIDVPFNVYLADPDAVTNTQIISEVISKTLPQGGAAEFFSVDSTKTLVENDTENAHVGVGTGRDGATGANDNYAGTWKVIGVELVWEPKPVRV